jgi:hypothetical protein
MARSRSSLFSVKNIFFAFAIVAALSTVIVLLLSSRESNLPRIQTGRGGIDSAFSVSKSIIGFEGALASLEPRKSSSQENYDRSLPISGGGGGGGSLVTGSSVRHQESGSDGGALFSPATGGDTGTCHFVDGLASSRLVDSNGQICLYADVDSKSGCCPQTSGSGPRSFQPSAAELTGVQFARHTCSGCDSNSGCCAELDVCIACCLHPDSRGDIDTGLRSAASEKKPLLFVYEELWSEGRHFEFCSYRCRTSSGSVHHENSYRSNRRHCYNIYDAAALLPTVNSDHHFRPVADQVEANVEYSSSLFNRIPREGG